MYFDDAKEIEKIAKRSGCSVFVVPNNTLVAIKGAIRLEPEDKTTITIDQVRETTKVLTVKQTSDVYVVIRPAEKLGLEAANALLKNLEEPGEKVHYVLVTSSLSEILPTILSRAAVYVLRQPDLLATELVADEKVRALAKRYITAKPSDLVGLAEEVTKKKDGVRSYALTVLGTAIEMLYRSYFITGKPVFISKIPKFLAAYEAIEQNGHVKLHLVAELV